ncbi:MAG: DUF2478 domain-containing protein [Rhodospirillales bacterium]|nr:DUF2478 domain-containing protein [Rhodospirillales bacterium]
MLPLPPKRSFNVPAAAVVYAPGSTAETLLGAFAADLAARGWRVGGLIQRTSRDSDGRKTGMELVALDTGESVPIGQPLGSGAGGDACAVDPSAVADASAVVRRAIAARADLVVINKFALLESTGRGLADEMLAAMAEGLPVLTSVPTTVLAEWMRFCGNHCQLLPAEPDALWRWWGADRMYEDLARGVGEGVARRVVIGLNWILVEGPDGVGLAQTPPREMPGCCPVPGTYGGRPLRDLAGLLFRSWNAFDTAVGMAAVNAHYNRFDLDAEAVNGLDDVDPAAGRLVVVGAFPNVAQRLPGAVVIERVPKDGEYPEWASEFLIPGAQSVLITASAAANRSLPRLVELARGARVTVVGPSATLASRLFSYGIDALSGFVVEDVEGLARVVGEAATAKTIKPYGRQVTIRRPTG